MMSLVLNCHKLLCINMVAIVSLQPMKLALLAGCLDFFQYPNVCSCGKHNELSVVQLDKTSASPVMGDLKRLELSNT